MRLGFGNMMSIARLTAAALAWLALSLCGPALAATITVGPGCTLAAAIASANANADTDGCTHEGSYGDDIIVLPTGTYDFTTPGNGVNALPAVTSNVTIVGGGSTLRRPLGDSSPFFRFFQVSGGAHLKLLDLTLTGGRVRSDSTAEGGAIRVTGSASLTLARVTLAGNTADGSDAVESGHRARGGAVFFDSSGVLALTLVALTGNSARATGATDGGSARGGGIAVGDEDDRGSLHMVDVSASGNSAIAHGLAGRGGSAEGGVVRYEGRAAMTVTRGTFIENSVLANGGADHGGSTAGGAIYFEATQESATLSLASVIASSNILSAMGAAPGNGGGAEGGGLYYRSRGAGLSVRDSTFSNNVLNVNAGTGRHGGGAEGGGADIEAGGGTVTIVRSSFTGNTLRANGGTSPQANGGSADGGGISFPSSGNLVLIAVTVANNTSSADAGTQFGGSSDGGGVYFDSGGTLTILNSTIVGNSGSASGGGTSEGGGFYLDFGSATVQNSLFATNLAGGVASNCAKDSNNEVLTSLGNNLFDNVAGCNVVGTDKLGAPGIGALSDAGQPGGIHFPLQAGSGALDSANPAACPAIDQLAHPRDGMCDIGAVERIGAIPQTTLVAAVLPSGRAGLVGNVLTAFVTVINSGPATAIQVGIGLGSAMPALLSFQTTDPGTNALTGTANAPVDIGPGAMQTFVIALLSTGPFDPTDLTLTFAGVNTAPVAANVGLNTLLMSASLTDVADVVALNATAGGNGIVDIPGDTGNGGFAVATINLGATDAITVEAHTGGVALGVLLFICQTDPGTGACQAAPSSTVTTVIATNGTPTFGIFVAGGGPIAFDPAVNRIFVLLVDSSGKIRGGTSVAVRTVAP